MAFEVINLNLIPTGEPPVIHAAQYDIGRPMIINMYIGEDAWTPEDVDIELQVRKVDANIVTVGPDSVDGNTITFLTTEQMTACSGSNICVLKFSNDSDGVIATLYFYLVVQRDVMQGGLTSDTTIHNLETQIEELLPGALGDNYYTKTEVDELIEEIPTFDPDNYYDKTTTDTLLSAKANTSSLSAVATSGDYDDLLNKPTIPAAQVQSDWSQSDNTQVDFIKNKPTVAEYGTELPMSTLDNRYVTSVINAICELPTVKSSSGSIATFDTDLTENLVDCVANIDATLSGVSSVNVTRCGKNFLPITVNSIKALNIGTWSGDTYLVDGLSFEILSDSNGYVTEIKVNGSRSKQTYFNLFIGTLPIEDYILNGCPDNSSNTTYFLNISATGLDQNVYTDYTLNNDLGITYTLRIYVRANVSVSNKIFTPMIRLATETDASFEPYNGTTYPISLGETLTQGGSLNVKTGLLTRTDTTTSQLSGMPDIRTLIGNNNIFADTGDISVKYLETIGKAISE